MKDTGELRIEVEAHVPWARGVVRRFAAKIGFSEKALSEIELCVSELATNLVVHHAKNGRINFYEIKENGLRTIEIVVADEGPGITDVKEALQGGTSSSGSLGQGLASVQRLVMSSRFIPTATGLAFEYANIYPRRNLRLKLNIPTLW